MFSKKHRSRFCLIGIVVLVMASATSTISFAQGTQTVPWHLVNATNSYLNGAGVLPGEAVLWMTAVMEEDPVMKPVIKEMQALNPGMRASAAIGTLFSASYAQRIDVDYTKVNTKLGVRVEAQEWTESRNALLLNQHSESGKPTHLLSGFLPNGGQKFGKDAQGNYTIPLFNDDGSPMLTTSGVETRSINGGTLFVHLEDDQGHKYVREMTPDEVKAWKIRDDLEFLQRLSESNKNAGRVPNVVRIKNFICATRNAGIKVGAAQTLYNPEFGATLGAEVGGGVASALGTDPEWGAMAGGALGGAAALTAYGAVETGLVGSGLGLSGGASVYGAGAMNLGAAATPFIPVASAGGAALGGVGFAGYGVYNFNNAGEDGNYAGYKFDIMHPVDTTIHNIGAYGHAFGDIYGGLKFW